MRSACFTLSVSLCRLVVARVPYRWIRSFRIALRTPFVESDCHAADMRKEFSHGKIRAKLIMELREQSVSRRSIASSRHMSMDSVSEVFDIAAERSITWDQVKDMPEDEVYSLFCLERHRRDSVFSEPDWDYVHKEMAKVGVNLRLLHDEYETECRSRCDVAMGCTKFCEGYGSHVVANSLTKRIEHKAGTSC